MQYQWYPQLIYSICTIVQREVPLARPQRVGADALFDQTMLILCGSSGDGVGEYSTPLTLLFIATKPCMLDLTEQQTATADARHWPW